MLQKAGLVSAQRKARERQFQFETAQLQEAKAFLDAVSAHWDQALARLKTFIEAE